MVQYRIKTDYPHQQFIQFEVVFPVSGDETTVHLPRWRPGRYELGNFAKNVRDFSITSKGKKLSFQKDSSSSWKVNTAGLDEIVVKYNYYATELNAGSSFFSEEQLYVNPVNCFVYTDETANQEAEVEVQIPDTYEIACQMRVEGHKMFAPNFDFLADSPFIASANLKKETYEVAGVQFHVWVQGMQEVNWGKLIPDFQKFTQKQIEKFVEFPVSEYHFLIQILPYKAYHGVEHQASTVISLGPTYDVFGDLYKELLGVSSHELYHTWNVKAIRPIEMYPYNFKQENYSKLGYLCEGVTTYMGDLFLLKSGVFNFEQYALEFNVQLQRHFDNMARFHTSVADSSYDTWLDGYVPGIPGRKLSIYTEGCLLAFLSDVRIRQATLNKYGLDEVMKRLYFEYALKNKGVSEEDYFAELERITGDSWSDWRRDYFEGKSAFEAPLVEALEYLGLDLEHEPSASYKEAKLGLKTLPLPNGGDQIMAIYPGSPSDMGALMLEDIIVAVNGYRVQGDLDRWLTYLDDQPKTLLIQRKGEFLTRTLPVLNRTFYNTYKIARVKDPNSAQKKAFEYWVK